MGGATSIHSSYRRSWRARPQHAMIRAMKLSIETELETDGRWTLRSKRTGLTPEDL